MKNLKKLIVFGTIISIISFITIIWMLHQYKISDYFLGIMVIVSVSGLAFLASIFIMPILADYNDFLRYFADGKISDAKYLNNYVNKISQGSLRWRMFYARVAYAYFNQNMISHIIHDYYKIAAKKLELPWMDPILEFMQHKNSEICENKIVKYLGEVQNINSLLHTASNHVILYGLNFHSFEELADLVYKRIKELHISESKTGEINLEKFSKEVMDFVYLNSEKGNSPHIPKEKKQIYLHITENVYKLFREDHFHTELASIH